MLAAAGLAAGRAAAEASASSLSLAEAQRLALQNNTDLRVAETQVAAPWPNCMSCANFPIR